MLRTAALVTAALLLLVASGGAAQAQSKGKPGTYKVGATVNAHTLMVCSTKDNGLQVVEAYKISDAEGDAIFARLENTKTVMGDATCGRIDGTNMVRIADLPVVQVMAGGPKDQDLLTLVKMSATRDGRTLWALIWGKYGFVR